MSSGNNDIRLELYRQAWQQARHNELMRASFGALNATMIVGVLTFMAATNPPIKVFPFTLMTVISLLGLLSSLRFGANARRWTRTQQAIQSAPRANLPDGMDPRNVAPAQGWERITNYFRADILFPTLYSMSFTVFLVLTVATACAN